MTLPDIPQSQDTRDRFVVRAASFATLLLGACIVVFSLTDLPFDDAARNWISPVPAATPGAIEAGAAGLSGLSAADGDISHAELNALSCWYLPYTPHELLVAHLHQGAGMATQETCLGRVAADRLVADNAALLAAYDALGQVKQFTAPPGAPDAGAALSGAVALDLGRIALTASAGAEERRRALASMAGRLGTLRRIAGADLPIALRAASLRGMVYILRLAPVIIGDDAQAATLFRQHAGDALDVLLTDSDGLERAARRQTAMRVAVDGLDSAGGHTLANELLVLKPALYARFCMDMARAALASYDPDDAAGSLNALRTRADHPLEALGHDVWTHPVQAAAMEPLLRRDGGVLVGFLIDLIQFNELRRMLLVNIAALEQGQTGENMADFAASRGEGLHSTLTGRAFELDAHSGDLVAAPAEGDKLAYTLRLYLGRGGGAITAQMIWPPADKKGESSTAAPADK